MADRILNPFSNMQLPDSGSEMIVQAKPAAIDEAVEKAYKVFEGLDFVYNPYQISRLEEQILSPSQIESLLQVIISETERQKSETTGLYFTRLIQDSYDAGNNDFVLTTEDTHIHGIGYNLSGSKERLLKIRIDGNAGDWCGRFANLVEIAITGNAGGSCVCNANYSKITVYGNVGYECGWGANFSEITIYGNASDYFGNSAHNTIFTAHNELAYGMLKKHVSSKVGNTIRLADPSGKILGEEYL